MSDFLMPYCGAPGPRETFVYSRVDTAFAATRIAFGLIGQVRDSPMHETHLPLLTAALAELAIATKLVRRLEKEVAS